MSGVKLRPGEVVRLRINPQDCLSALDLLQKVGLDTAGRSFSQIISLAFASLMETARVNKMLPEPDTFQYMNRMAPYIGNGHAQHKVRHNVATKFGGLGERFVAPVMGTNVLPMTSCPHGNPHSHSCELCDQTIAETALDVSAPAELSRQRTRLSELYSRKMMREDGDMSVEWTAGDEVEFNNLFKVVYPEG